MSYKIAKQSDDLYVIWCTITDTICAIDMTQKDVIDYFVEKAIEDTKRSTEEWLSRINRNIGMTYEQMLQSHKEENCDDYWNKKIKSHLKE